MNWRFIILFLCVTGVISIWRGCRSKPLRQVPKKSSSTDENNNLKSLQNTLPAQNPHHFAKSVATSNQPSSAEDKIVTKKEESYRPHYEEDSPRTISELKVLYASNNNLNATLKLAKPTSRYKGPGLIDEGVYKLSDERLASFRRHWSYDGSGNFTPESCFSLRLPGQPVLVGEFSDGTLKVLTLPDPYSFIYVLNGTYYFLDVMEYSRWRADQREDQPYILNLYKSISPSEIIKIGEWLRASIDGVANSDAFKMSIRQFCESVPEQRAN